MTLQERTLVMEPLPDMELAARRSSSSSMPAYQGGGGRARVNQSPARAPVFIVDADELSRRTMERALQRAGHSVHTFGTAEALLNALRRTTPAAVCIDSSLPGMSGLQAVPLIRAHSPNIGVVMVSGDQQVRGVVQALRAGAWDYLTKPIDGETLVQCVGQAIRDQASTAPALGSLDRNGFETSTAMTLDELERHAIEAALKRTRGNVTQAMKQLGIGRTTLYRKLKRYGLR
jgi:DNA-binding NtrC family response regulator